MVMVKPGMAYLDIVRQTKDKVKHHECCYNLLININELDQGASHIDEPVAVTFHTTFLLIL